MAVSDLSIIGFANLPILGPAFWPFTLIPFSGSPPCSTDPSSLAVVVGHDTVELVLGMIGFSKAVSGCGPLPGPKVGEVEGICLVDPSSLGGETSLPLEPHEEAGIL
jgi:hypothetical protein